MVDGGRRGGRGGGNGGGEIRNHEGGGGDVGVGGGLRRGRWVRLQLLKQFFYLTLQLLVFLLQRVVLFLVFFHFTLGQGLSVLVKFQLQLQVILLGGVFCADLFFSLWFTRNVVLLIYKDLHDFLNFPQLLLCDLVVGLLDFELD